MTNPKVEYDYLQKIIEFNGDKDIIALREKYKEPTFFEIISKQRSETTYSSFLKWMFQSSSTDLSTVSPILLLLDVLVQRSQVQEKKPEDKINLIDKDLKKHIITRNFKINNIEVETEKSVSTLASELYSDGKREFEELNDVEDIKKVIAKCQDRIDIFIRCNIEINKKEKELHIVIENKIDSVEGGVKSSSKTNTKYDEATQTQRYYMASALKDKKDIMQLYVYLAPEGADECESNKYIRINYQDIIDSIVIPMLASSKLSIRERFFLEELKTELTFPSLEGNNVKSSIALSDENTDKFSDLWNNYKGLIIAAAIEASGDNYWGIKKENDEENETIYYDKFPKDNIVEMIEREDCNDSDINILKGKINKKSVIEIASKHNLKVIEYKCNKMDLLETFWNNNKRFLLAFMNGLEKDKFETIKCLTQEVSKRDTTKYTVFYDNNNLNNKWLGKNKLANNAETAWLIIKAWVELEKSKNISLSELNTTFNKDNSNTYYKSGKWLKNLFHKFEYDNIYTADGDDNVGASAEAGGWDFYKPKNLSDKKFRISTNEGDDYAIMLKMWRKDGLQKLIDLVTNPNNNYFKEGTLTVQPDK